MLRKNFAAFNWPSQSPNTNPIDNICLSIKSKVKPKRIILLEQLFKTIKKLDAIYLRNTYMS